MRDDRASGIKKMAEILITIDDEEEIEKLDMLALKNDLSTIDYATGIIRSFLQRQIRGDYNSFTNKAKLETLKKKLGRARSIPAALKEDMKNGN